MTLNIQNMRINHNNSLVEILESGVRVGHRDFLHFNGMVMDDDILINSIIINRLLTLSIWKRSGQGLKKKNSGVSF